MKRTYIKPLVEVYGYTPEQGYAASVALAKDYVLVLGEDGSTQRNGEEITEFTGTDNEYETGGLWTF